MSSQPYERAAVVSTIDPVNNNNATANGDYVDMSKFGSALFICLAGAMDQTLDFSVRESQDTGGTGEQTLSGKSITQEAGGDDDNLQWVIQVRAEEMSAGYRYLRPRVTSGNGTTNLVAVVGLGMDPRFGPASDDDLSSVDQVIT